MNDGFVEPNAGGDYTRHAFPEIPDTSAPPPFLGEKPPFPEPTGPSPNEVIPPPKPPFDPPGEDR